MSTTTSSEDKMPDDESPQRGSETADDNEQPLSSYQEHEEPERKRRRTATEKAREMRMQSYAKARIREIDSAKSHGSDSRRRTPSVEPSVTKSDDGSRLSPVPRALPPARVGKRVRRKPQRWEGERLYRVPRVSRREGSLRDDDSTASIRSTLSVAEPPVVDNPFDDLQTAIIQCRSQPSRRDIVDSFHSWQLRIVSKQAAQQKALHIFLKRRLRKRNTRSPEYDRMEDDALRSARSMATKMEKSNDIDEGDHDTTVEDEVNRNGIVPDKLRLPLEAYLPRRVRPRGKEIDPQMIFDMLPDAPHYPDSKVELDESGEQKWMTLPTVSASAEWNTRKSNTRRRAPGSKTEATSARAAHDGERIIND